MDDRIDRLGTLIDGIRTGLSSIITQTNILVRTIQQPNAVIQNIINELNTLKQTFTNVKNSIEVVKGEYAKIWLNLTENMTFTNVTDSTNVRNFRRYRNTRLSRVNRGVPTLTRYPKLKNMVAVLKTLKTESNRQAEAREQAATRIQAAQRRRAATQAAQRRRAQREQAERNERNRQLERERRMNEIEQRRRAEREQSERNRQALEQQRRQNLLNKTLPNLRALELNAQRIQNMEFNNNNRNN